MSRPPSIRFPSLFVSHGASSFLVGQSSAKAFLGGLGARLGRPRAIVVATSHWETGRPRIGAARNPETIHDFCTAQKKLYDLRYPAPGAPDLARAIAAMLEAAGMGATLDPDRGLDRAVWAPLALLYPAADIPVVPLSIQTAAGPAHHLALGQALAPLIEEGVLVIGSGSVTHNLHALHGRAEDAPAPDWVEGFQDWLADRLAARDTRAVLEARCTGPFGRENHPTPEHLLPLYVALGAAGPGALAERLHRGHTHAVLATDIYTFTPAAAPAADRADAAVRESVYA